MDSYTSAQIKKELSHSSREELLNFCARMIRFKKDNKMLMSYLLFWSKDESEYVENVQAYIQERFSLVNKKSYFYMRKSVRKILSDTKQFIKYSPNKVTEIELLLFFCKELKALRPSMHGHVRLFNIYKTQMDYIKRLLPKLHEDLQYDFNLEIESLENH